MEADILEHILDQKLLKILRLFFQNYDGEFYLREIAQKTKVPVASTFRLMQKLVSTKLINSRTVKTLKLYKLADNEHTRFLGQLIKKEKQALEVFITRAKSIDGMETILLQGKEERDKANVILIGRNIDQAKTKQLCATIKEEFGFKITALVLEDQQFEQMDAMGLYPGEKRIIFQRGI